jgi:uncharacterized membrane-anchored protein YhcB (DUF1043 family)
MSWEAIFAGLTLVYLIGGGVISYWVNTISKSQDKLSDSQMEMAKDLKEFQLKVTEEFAKKVDIATRLDRIDDILDKIFDKLAEKVNKTDLK